MSRIKIKKSPTADTRTCDVTTVDKQTLLNSSRQHITDSEGKYGCIDDYLKECFLELYKLKEMNEYGGMGNVNHDVLYRHRINS